MNQEIQLYKDGIHDDTELRAEYGTETIRAKRGNGYPMKMFRAIMINMYQTRL